MRRRKRNSEQDGNASDGNGREADINTMLVKAKPPTATSDHENDVKVTSILAADVLSGSAR